MSYKEKQEASNCFLNCNVNVTTVILLAICFLNNRNYCRNNPLQEEATYMFMHSSSLCLPNSCTCSYMCSYSHTVRSDRYCMHAVRDMCIILHHRAFSSCPWLRIKWVILSYKHPICNHLPYDSSAREHFDPDQIITLDIRKWDTYCWHTAINGWNICYDLERMKVLFITHQQCDQRKKRGVAE